MRSGKAMDVKRGEDGSICLLLHRSMVAFHPGGEMIWFTDGDEIMSVSRETRAVVSSIVKGKKSGTGCLCTCSGGDLLDLGTSEEEKTVRITAQIVILCRRKR